MNNLTEEEFVNKLKDLLNEYSGQLSVAIIHSSLHMMAAVVMQQYIKQCVTLGKD